MKRLSTVLLFLLLAFPAGAAQNRSRGFWPALGDYISGLGIPVGGLAIRVCEQTADDVTPSMGGAVGGCNVLLTSESHGAGVTVTRLDDVISGIDATGTFEEFIWIIGRAATNQTTIQDGGNFVLKTIPWDSPASGDHSVLALKTTYMTGSVTAVGDGGSGTSLDVTSNGHGMVVDQTVTLSDMSVAAYDGTYQINTVADANTFNVTAAYSATATGTWEAIRFDELYRSGNVDDYLYQNLYVNEGNSTDFTAAQVVVGHSDTGETANSDRIGLVGEATADGSDQGRGLAGWGKTSSAEDGTGVLGIGLVNAGTDTTTAYGGIFASAATHGSGPNVGVFCTASAGSTSYCLQLEAGDINSLAAINWLMLDNSATAKSWDAAGAADILKISTLDGEETVAVAAKQTLTTALDVSSGNEVAFDLAYTTDKAAGNDTGLRLRMTDMASGGVSLLFDYGVATSPQLTLTNAGLLTLYGSSWTDTLTWYHDETDAYQKWLDGNMIFQTDEGTNTSTVMEFKPKGTSEVSSLGLYDTDTRELWLHTDANRGYLDSGTGALGLQSNVVQDLNIWEAIGSGNPSVNIYGWNTAGSDLESTELTMDDTNDEFLIRAANSANHEGVTIELDEANQLFRVRGSDGAVDFSSSDTALLAVNAATFNSTIDAESYMSLGNGSSLASNKTLIIDRDFSDASDGEALSVVGSQIEVTAGTGDIHHTMMSPGASTFSTAATLHGYASTLTLLEPNIALNDGATLSHASTLRIVNAPTEGTTSNWALWVDDGGTKLDGALTVDGLTTLGGGLLMGGDLDMNDNAILNPLAGIYGEAPVADTDPDDILIHAEHSFSSGSQTAANLVLSGGLGDGYVFESTDYLNSTGDKLTIIVGHCAAGVCAVLGAVTLTESTHWDCDVTSDAVCACALYTYLAANLPTGIASVSRSDGTCTDAKVFLQPEDEGTYSLILAAQDTGGGGVWGTATNGTNGLVIIGSGGGSGSGGLALSNNGYFYINVEDVDTHFRQPGLDYMRLAVGASDINFIEDADDRVNFGTFRLYSSEALNLGGDYIATKGGVLDSVVIGKDAGNISWEAEGIGHQVGTLNLYNDITTIDQGSFILGTGTDSLLVHSTTQNPNSLVLGIGLESNTLLFIQKADNGVDFKPVQQADPTIKFQAADATHIGEALAIYKGGLWADHPVTDIASHDIMVNGADAWSQATVGVTRNGANVDVSAGTRTMQLVCADETLSAGDTIVITVNGVATTFTEGGAPNQFDCVGAGSCELCMDDLGTAITTAAIGLTPDCDTTAGTCYLQPDQRSVHAVDSLVFNDTGVDGVLGALVEGTDGSVAIHTAYNALVIGPTVITPGVNINLDTNAVQLILDKGATGAGNGAIFFGQDTDLSLYWDSADTIKLDGSFIASASITATADIYGAQNVIVGSAGKFYFSGRAARWSSADGIWEEGVNDGTQGWRVDVATTADVASIYDESGNPITLGASAFQNTTAGATATFSSVDVAAGATGAVNSVSGNVTGVGDFVSGNATHGSGDSSNTAGDSGSSTWKSGDGIDDSGDLIAKMGLATNGTSGDFSIVGDGVNTYLTLNGETGATDVVNAFTAGSVASDAQVTGTYGTFTLGAAEKYYIDAATTEHTQTAGVLDIDLVPTTDAVGVVAADIHITAPALGIEATTHYGMNIQYTGDAQDEGASIVQLIQVGWTPNASNATVYGMYSNDNDFDYFIFNDGNAPSRFDGEVHFGNNAAAATFGLVTTDADVVLAFDAITTQGSITFMEDEDRFDFDNDVDVIGDLTAGTIAVDGLMNTQGGRIINVTTVNDANYTALVTDHIIAYTALSAARTIELLDADCDEGRTWDVKDEAGAAAAWNIIINPEGGTTIDGVLTVSITADYNSLSVYCRNSVWFTR